MTRETYTKCYTRNVIHENLIQNVVDKLFADSFLKNEDWAHLWINSLKFYTVCIDCMPSWELIKLYQI